MCHIYLILSRITIPMFSDQDRNLCCSKKLYVLYVTLNFISTLRNMLLTPAYFRLPKQNWILEWTCPIKFFTVINGISVASATATQFGTSLKQFSVGTHIAVCVISFWSMSLQIICAMLYMPLLYHLPQNSTLRKKIICITKLNKKMILMFQRGLFVLLYLRLYNILICKKILLNVVIGCLTIYST